MPLVSPLMTVPQPAGIIIDLLSRHTVVTSEARERETGLCNTQCLKWSKKEAGSLPQAEVERAPSPEFFIYLFIFDLKMASFDSFLVVNCMRFRATRE